MKELTNPEILIHPHDYKNKKDWQRTFKFLDKELDYKNIQSVLELGAGMGNLGHFILKRNPEAKVICEDISQDYLKIISQRQSKIETLLHDINQVLPFEDERFDLVSCIGTLHYFCVKNVKKVLEEMKRVSRRYILIDFFPKYSPYNFLFKIRYPKIKCRFFSQNELNKMFDELNLKTIAKFGNRTILPGPLFSYSGKAVFFLLEK